jgi:rubrerythrin
MKKPTDMGLNRTGVKASPIDAPRTEDAAEVVESAPEAGTKVMDAERASWSRDADPVGTVPPPTSIKGMAKSAVEMVKGQKPTVLLDKIGERLAFERTGTRLYEALLAKHAAASVHEGGPTREELEKIRDDELRHFAVLTDIMEKLGGDPTAMTPCADVTAVASSGLVQVLGDPRVTLTQALGAILIAELADHDGWTVLIELADGMGHDEIASQMRDCLLEEDEHLQKVRSWVAVALRGQAGVQPTATQQPQA